MTSGSDLDASHGDAPRGPALWEGRATPGPALAKLLPGVILLAIFAALTLLFMLNPAPKYLRIRGVGGWEQYPLDPGAAMLLPGAILFILAVVICVAVAATMKAVRQRYRIDGRTAEVAADGVIAGIAISDIRRVSASEVLGWQRVRITGVNRQRIEMLLGAEDAVHVLSVLQGLGVPCGALDAIELPASKPRLATGEPVRWRGRPGLASFDKGRAISVVGILLPFAIFVGVLLWLWGSDPEPFFGLMLTVFVLTLFGWPSLAALITYSGRLRVWLFDAFGAVVVTDRRIAWAAPGSGHFYRELMLSELVDAAIVEQRGRRAWIALTVRKGAQDVREQDLRGVPDAEAFLAAVDLRAR
ncbi:hypothetical protein HZY97_12920 [Sphingomonas sp. R-74633]|uniref:hypothetical protein n=1 Tax=Sphingomonas sp. R-74633 TaxID=2751188 RepID=UPI0015D21E83|nr:hypothetical protein [Sphingomonas sp. R-74633]NYT41667.1 hypothetical protein [Sphingomonas sp. R-74633]